MPDRQQDEQHHEIDGGGEDIGSRHILRWAAPGEDDIERYDEEAYGRAARDMVGGEMHRREGLPDRADQIETPRNQYSKVIGVPSTETPGRPNLHSNWPTVAVQ